jgi:hypothetical protein
MPALEIISKTTFKEVITSVELADLNGNGKLNVIITTLNGDVRVYDFNRGEKKPLDKICSIGDLPPLAAIGVGDVTGDGIPDFVMGGLDNSMRVLVYMDDNISIKATTSLGSLPTAIAVLNVLDDESAEVIVSTNDGSMRCYGWYDVALDKLAIKCWIDLFFPFGPFKPREYLIVALSLEMTQDTSISINTLTIGSMNEVKSVLVEKLV